SDDYWRAHTAPDFLLSMRSFAILRLIEVECEVLAPSRNPGAEQVASARARLRRGLSAAAPILRSRPEVHGWLVGQLLQADELLLAQSAALQWLDAAPGNPEACLALARTDLARGAWSAALQATEALAGQVLDDDLRRRLGVVRDAAL